MNSRTNSGSNLGFTIIELMIVVVILGVLASVAVMAYNQYVQKAHNSEATALLSDIRLKQEAYRATFHQYAFQTAGSGWTPGSQPDEQPRQWTATAGWNQLGVRPSDPVYFSYYCRAGAPGVDLDDSNLVEADELDISSITDNDFWFVAQAIHDVDGDGKCSGFEIHPGNAAIVSIKDGDGDDENTNFCRGD